MNDWSNRDVSLICGTVFSLGLFLGALAYEEFTIHAQIVPVVNKEKLALNLRPEDRVILAKAGWLDYVEKNIDVIEYFDYYALIGQEGSEYTGTMRRDSSGKYIARAALKRMNDSKLGVDLEICMTLVHEATHAAAAREFGNFSSDTDAEINKFKFYADYHLAINKEKDETNNNKSN